MTSSTPVTALPRRHLALLIVIIGGVATIGPASLDLYLPALPRVADDLHASSAAIALTMTAFLAGMGVGMLVAGSLSDNFGRRRPLLVGLTIYALSSLACAFAPSTELLVLLRVVQGMAGSTGFAIGQAVVADYARGTQAARMMSRLALVTYTAPIVAPLIGAQLLRFTSWRGVFVALAVLGGVLLLGAGCYLRESLPVERRVPSGLMRSLRTMGGLSRDTYFLGLLVAAALSTAAFYSYLAGVSLIFQDLGGLSAPAFSVVFAINAVGMLAATQLNHRLLGRFSPAQLILGFLVTGACGGTAAVIASLGRPLNVIALAVALFVVVASFASVFPNAMALALSRHPEVAGSASAVFGASCIVLGSLVTPLIGIGGGTSALPLALVIAVASAASLVVFLAGPWRARAAVMHAGPEPERASAPETGETAQAARPRAQADRTEA